MRLQNIKWVALLAVPEGHETVLIAGYYFPPMVTPYDYALLWFALRIAYSFGGAFLAGLSDVEDGDVTIDV